MSQPNAQTPDETFEAGIGIVNHTDRFIYSTLVNGQGGGHAYELSAGVAGFCCVTLPKKWYPGLTVEVVWDAPDGTKHVNKSKIVEVEQYDKLGELYLHFFSDDKVRVVVTKWIGASPKHPIAPPPETMMHRFE